MTVSSIYTNAMIELDEELEDVCDYEQKFRMYLNMGYQTILRQYYKPRETVVCQADKSGMVDLSGYDVERVVEMKDKAGRYVSFQVCADGCGVYKTSARDQIVYVVYEMLCPELVNDKDIPRIPEHVHHALVYYICYRHLSSGNLAKQSRAQYYLQSFYDAMRILKPVGAGSVTKYINLYSATEL